MAHRTWEIGICGTFDVENYGDLLFPLIAEAELRDRLGDVRLHRFSYAAKAPPAWPYEVAPVSALPEVVGRLDGLLIGGGFIVRFDRDVAPGYGPAGAELGHPTSYWLAPALMALQFNVPLIWNAPGTDCKVMPDWATELLDRVLAGSQYVAVRDEASRAALAALTEAPIAVVPDTAFGIARLVEPHAEPSPGMRRLREKAGLNRPYIIVQAKSGFQGFGRFIEEHAAEFDKYRFLPLPIGPVLGDSNASFYSESPLVVRLPHWPAPLEIAELIRDAEGVVAQSYHLSLTAAAFGVPVFARHGLPPCKYSILERFETHQRLPPYGMPDPGWFGGLLGRKEPSPEMTDVLEALRLHWDRVAEEICRGKPKSRSVFHLWHSLPGFLEGAATRARQAAEAAGRVEMEAVRQEAAACQAQLAQEAERDRQLLQSVSHELASTQVAYAAAGARVSGMEASISWRISAPLRALARSLVRSRQNLIDMDRIGRHPMETEPYAWAAIDKVFSDRDAAELVASFPRDHYKRISRSDEGREYHYDVRSLIRMGARASSHPADLSKAWRRLAADLLSGEYRLAMTRLTRLDLSGALMEANAFHYGPGGFMDAHQDLPEKLVTHIFYFNQSWDAANGGCLRILRSRDLSDVAAEVLPVAGNSGVIVRSERSWHAVSRVADSAADTRRCLVVTFFRPGSISTMWPPGDNTPLHTYSGR